MNPAERRLLRKYSVAKTNYNNKHDPILKEKLELDDLRNYELNKLIKRALPVFITNYSRKT